MTNEQKKIFRFPDFMKLAVTFSYDDGVLYDERLIEIFNTYGMKGTFNINSGLFSEGRRMSKEDAVRVYGSGTHEIAAHGEKHLHLTSLGRSGRKNEIANDIKNLKKIFGAGADGWAYAYGEYNAEVMLLLKEEGISYARTVKSTHGFAFPKNWLAWHPTCHHTEDCLQEMLTQFICGQKENEEEEAKLFYLWGHSYEFNDHDNWDVIEDTCRKLAAVPGLWKATNGDIYTYVNAFERLEYSEGEWFRNPSSVDLYLNIDGRNRELRAGEEITL